MSLYAPIAAIATAPAAGDIGVVRISGPDLSRTCTTAVRASADAAPRASPAVSRRRRRGDRRRGSPSTSVLRTPIPAKTYWSCRDMAAAVLRRILARCLQAGHDLGLRPAEPGEFTAAPFSTSASTWPRPRPWPTSSTPPREAAARAAPWRRCRASSQQRQRPVRPHHPPAHASGSHPDFPRRRNRLPREIPGAAHAAGAHARPRHAHCPGRARA